MDKLNAASHGLWGVFPADVWKLTLAYLSYGDLKRTLTLNSYFSKITPAYAKRKYVPSRIDELELTSVLGGSFSRLLRVRAKRNNDHIFAMKALRLSSLAAHSPKSWRVPDHPFLLPILSVIQTQERLYVLRPWMEHGNMFSHLLQAKTFTEDQARFYAAELLLALECLHENDIIAGKSLARV